MNKNSHKQIALHYARRYLTAHPSPCRSLFILGCMEPDVNPSTYLKGSIRHQWLRGHNWKNAKGYIMRLSRRLESRQHLRYMDFYILGKLIHYTLDAFTYAHNSHFPGNLFRHREYEKRLEDFLSQYFEACLPLQSTQKGSLFQIIRHYKAAYHNSPVGFAADLLYGKSACNAIFEKLLLPSHFQATAVCANNSCNSANCILQSPAERATMTIIHRKETNFHELLCRTVLL